MRLWLVMMVSALALSPAWAAAADEAIAIIVPSPPPAIQFDLLTLRDIFLKRISIDRLGTGLIPLNLPPDHPLRQAFSQALLGASPRDLQNYWNQRYFHGVSPPYVLSSDEAILRFVAKTPGAIGYVAPCDVDARVKEVARIPVPEDMAGVVGKLCQSAPAAAEK
jgi:ABC-type phosphate transport system substrate-binding protein